MWREEDFEAFLCIKNLLKKTKKKHQQKGNTTFKYSMCEVRWN